MSVEAVEKYFESIADQEAEIEKLNTITEFNRIVQMAREKGYEFTSDELQTVMQAVKDEELSEEELMTVSGGVSTQDVVNYNKGPELPKNITGNDMVDKGLQVAFTVAKTISKYGGQ